MCNSTNYEFYKSHHICVRCGQEDAERNSTLCFRCRIKSRESAMKYYENHKEEINKKKRISDKLRYNRLKDLGLCTCCGKRKAEFNKSLCNQCRARKNACKRQKYLLTVYATKNMCNIRV